MNLAQLTSSDRLAIEARANQATKRAAAALSQLTGQPVDTAHTRFHVESLSDTIQMLEGLPTRVTVVYLEIEGDIASQMMLVLPAATAMVLTRALLPSDSSERDKEDTFGEVGNIVLSSFLSELVAGTMLSADPSPPMVGTDDFSAMLQLPLSRAASDSDVVISFETTMSIADEKGKLRAPFHLLFMPAPGSLSRILETIDTEDVDRELRIPVRMGEMSVSSRRNDVLVATALGSCVAIALVDRLGGVAAVAHVMLPSSPAQWKLAGRATYAARYADTAVPALIHALERAGGRRVVTRAYLAGGGQMFRGALAERMDVNLRNIAAVKDALKRHGIRVHAEHTGGSISRALEVSVASGHVTCRIERNESIRLDDAA